MGLVITHDGEADGELAERCCMCRTPTRWWYGAGDRNVALCQSCANTTKECELPMKKDWCDKERALNPRAYGYTDLIARSDAIG